LVIFIHRIGSGAASSAGNGNCARHHVVDILARNYNPKKKMDHDMIQSNKRREDVTREDKK
jgi:hypothetical protein